MLLGRIGDYEILERVGAGGMSVVFRALDTRLERIVALKVLSEELSSDPECQARFLREARAEATLSHPNIATFFDVGEAALDPPDLLAPGTPGPHPARVTYLAMEFVPGEDLLATLQREPVPVSRVLDLGIQIASGLEAAHRAGIVHRDLKPGNVRVTPEGSAKILDFGLARVRASTRSEREGRVASYHTSENRVLGTLDYMSPEQAQGAAVDERSDLFSFGTLLYQVITGRLPFKAGSAAETLYAITNEDPQPLARYAASVPPELQRVVGKLIAKRPGDRYQSAHEVVTDLSRLRADLEQGRGARRPPARWRAWALGAAALAAAAAVLWVAITVPFGAGARSLAVLPFHNQTGDPAYDRVASGFADAVQGDLVQFTNLNVVSRASAAGLDTSVRPVRALAHALGVGTVLSGEVRERDGEVRVAVELITARTGLTRWARTYEYAPVQFFRIKRDIVQQVAARFGTTAEFGQTGSGSGYPTRSLGAHDAYLEGMRALDDSDDPAAPARSAEWFSRALVLDPEFALAWVGRSRAQFRLYGQEKSPELLRSAEEAAEEALRLDPRLLEARLARAQIYRGTGRGDQAIAELERVLRERPNWDEPYAQLGAAYRDAGRLDLAERSLLRAIELRRDYWRNWNTLGGVLKRRGDYAGARRAYEQVVHLDPGSNVGYKQLAAIAMLEGRTEDAIAAYRRLPAPVDDPILASNIGSAYFYARRLDEAKIYYDLAVRLEPRNPIWHENLADLYTRMGRVPEAHDRYHEAVALVEAQLKVNPGSVDLAAERILDLAKAGDCDAALSATQTFGSGLTNASADAAYVIAKSHAVCGRAAPALAALGWAIRLGVSPKLAQQDDEFRALAQNPEFRRLTANANGAR